MRERLPKLLLDVWEAADMLSIGRSKLLALTYEGKIPSLKIGRRRLFPVEGLIAWTKDQMIDPSARSVVEAAPESVLPVAPIGVLEQWRLDALDRKRVLEEEREFHDH
jgi:excisionase family DNA binding protein